MKKKLFPFLLMTLAVLGLSQVAVSCSDDDDDNKTEQRDPDANPMDTEETNVAWRWLSALTDAESLPTNWSSKTWEPIVGVASENNANTRIVVVNTIDEARQQFSDLADVKTSQLATEYTVSQSGVGRMTWTPSPEGAQNLAEVSVDTKLIPHLQKIVYCTEEQTGHNGLFGDNCDGTAYYRLGDVIRDSKGYYWVCVRPSFYPKKGDSHWINIFNAQADPGIPEDNIYSNQNKSKKYNNKTVLLPYNLKYKREHIYNLGNLLHAVKDPNAYLNAMDPTDSIGLGSLHYHYHGVNFIKAVGEYWDQTYPESGGKTIYQLLFNCDRATFNRFRTFDFIYKGYTWWFGSTGDIYDYFAGVYLPEIDGSESGDKKEFDANKGYDINILAHANNADYTVAPGKPSEQYPMFVVRYKTGDQLMENGKYTPYEKLNNCTDIYRYNLKTGDQVHDPVKRDWEVTNLNELAPLKAPVVGCLIGADGKFYKTVKAAEKSNTKARAMVVYLGGDKRVEKGANWNGLAISLEDIKSGNVSQFHWNEDFTRNIYCTTATGKQQYLSRLLDGLAMTKRLVNHECGQDHRHPAANAVNNWSGSRDIANQGNYTYSTWFLPSAGQWILAMQGIGARWTDSDDGFRTGANFRNLFAAAGLTTDNAPKVNYVTTTEYHYDQYWYILLSSNDNEVNFSIMPKDNDGFVRAFIAFKYDDGASQDPQAMPAESLPQLPQPGYVLTHRGHFFATAADARNNNEQPIALVACARYKGDLVETEYVYRGLAIALKDIPADYWVGLPQQQIYATQADIDKVEDVLNGIAQTNHLISQSATVGASQAQRCHDYKPDLTGGASLQLDQYSFSGWFLPSAGQWIMAAEGLGAKWQNTRWTTSNREVFQLFQNAFNQAGLADARLTEGENTVYWTSTQSDINHAWSFGQALGVYANIINTQHSTASQPARPFIAFTVD